MSLYNIKKIQIASVAKVSSVIFAIVSFITGFCLFFIPAGFKCYLPFSYKFCYWMLFTIGHTLTLTVLAVFVALIYNAFANKYGIKITLDLEAKE